MSERSFWKEMQINDMLGCKDQNGSPVPGAMINFCTDESCQFFQSDDSGVITFTGAPYAYHLQILKLPEGYSFDPGFEAYTEPHTSELTVTVKKD